MASVPSLRRQVSLRDSVALRGNDSLLFNRLQQNSSEHKQMASVEEYIALSRSSEARSGRHFYVRGKPSFFSPNINSEHILLFFDNSGTLRAKALVAFRTMRGHSVGKCEQMV